MVTYGHSDLVLGLRFRLSELATLVVAHVSEHTHVLVCKHVHRLTHVGTCGVQRLTSGCLPQLLLRQGLSVNMQSIILSTLVATRIYMSLLPLTLRVDDTDVCHSA